MARPIRPIDVRDGSRARAAAADAADWVTVRSADGHPFCFPPEAAHRAAEGAPWETLDALVELALIARATARRQGSRPPEAHSARPATLATAAALAAYIDNGQDLQEDMKDRALAKAVADFAVANDLADADLLNPESGVMRDMMGRALAAIIKTRQRDRG